MDPEPTLAEIQLIAQLVAAMDCGEDERFEQLRAELGWPLGRLAREMKRAGLIDDWDALPLP